MRPILVLVLVLAALAALVFGVLHFLGDPQPAQGDPGAAVTEGPSPRNAPDTDLENVPREAGDRTDSPQEAEARTTATSDGQSYQYDNALTGIVQNMQGQPLSGAEVTLSTYVELIFVGDPIDFSQDRSTRTDSTGRYSFTRLEPRSSYKLTAKHKDYKFEDNIQSVPVGEKGNFEEPPIVLTTGATLTGYVKDEGGNNVDGATLVLDGLLYQGAPYDPPDRMIAKTDNRGMYEFKNVPPGPRQLAVSAPGYGTAHMNSLNFVKDEIVPKDFTLSVGEMIRGRVVCQGQGIPNATVQAFSLANTNAISRGQAVTDATGEFTLENLAPGEYNLLAGARGYRPEGNVTRQRTGTDNVLIEVSKEADVCGRVLDNATGAPVTSFTCRLRTNNGPGMATSVTEYTGTFNDPNGEFCLVGIPAGSYVIEASAHGFAPTFSAPVNVARGQAPTGNVVRLTKGGTISGRVVDASGKPVARARITTHDREWSDDSFSQMLGSAFPSNVTQVDVRSGEDGRFTLRGMTPEVYQVNIRAPGFTRWIRTDVLVAEGEDTNLGDVALATGGTIRGTLFDAAGRPLVGGLINVVADDGREGLGYTTKSGSDGKFLIMNVTPGSYLINASRSVAPGDGTPFDRFQDARNSQKSLTVTDGNTSTVELSLSP